MPLAAGKLETDMRVHFTADHDYTPSGEARVTIAYKAGMTETVKKECGERAIGLGRAELVPDPLDHDGNGRKGGTKVRA